MKKVQTFNVHVCVCLTLSKNVPVCENLRLQHQTTDHQRAERQRESEAGHVPLQPVLEGQHHADRGLGHLH